ncbi:hypothetical protein CSPAE12_09023 [Colletotrichum incanum]|nr:hypothetical protein CSPAE12_09023 [Colletotrichum incanum]
MKAFRQAPSLHRRSTFIRYQFELTRIQIVSRWICYLGHLQYLLHRELPLDPLRMACFRSSAFYFWEGKGFFICLCQLQGRRTHETGT